MSAKRESFLHGSKKLSLPLTVSAAGADPLEVDPLSEPARLTRERRSDLMSWSTERVGLEWLFEHTDSETDCTPGIVPPRVPSLATVIIRGIKPFKISKKMGSVLLCRHLADVIGKFVLLSLLVSYVKLTY